MSQSGYTPIQLYRTTTAAAAPTSGNLAAGELAINLTDEKLYFKNAAGTVKTLASSGASTVGGSNTQVQFNSSGTLAGSANFVFDGTNVGIGATPAAWFGNSRVLQLGSGGTLEGRSNLPNLVQLSANSYIDAAGVTKYINTAAASSYLQYLGAHTWYTAASGSAGATVTFTQAMTLDASGNLSLGAVGAFSIPGTKLSITNPSANAYLSVYGGTGSTDGGILLGGNNAENFANIFYSTSSNYVQIAATPAGSQLKFDTAGSERMRIDASGNVGIGTTSPTVRADVLGVAVGNSAVQPLLQLRSATDALSNSVEMLLTPLISGQTRTAIGGVREGATANASIYFATNNTEQFRILSTGGITSANLVDAVGYKGLPQNSQTASYTLALADMGKMINTTTGGVVIPANASVAFPIGSAISIFNNSGSNQTISITSDTLRLAGTATTGSRTLAQYGIATCVKVAATTWAISGNVT
jgi:hypothetical protein